LSTAATGMTNSYRLSRLTTLRLITTNACVIPQVASLALHHEE